MALTSPRFSANDRLRKAAENAPPLKQGERGQAVAIIQLALTDLGLAMPSSTNQGRTLPDGIFGPETARRIRSFQTANGLVADAIVGPLTMAALERAIIAQSALNRRADAAKARTHSAAVR
ncbi:hypothetical protein B6S44_06270 [Bosea sp. Tri-44]|uniref:peptidoglycan-binding domain-containing protein n=1 Tax=Bosea sp. Tri-44 TaxID=1972137 RepID=UPI00100EECEF|nr:peptidoglycan-binding domain-containing protein [Bosea sp. Tri-44]RXT56657.1 hypothetical protein B6S44_06270 [Bosea sp. Tri-44]